MSVGDVCWHAQAGVLTACLHCADPGDAARRRNIIIGCTVAAGTALLTAAALLLVWRLRGGKQPQGISVSQSTIRQLSASSAVDLTFELDKNKSPILLGKGAFGEVSLSPPRFGFPNPLRDNLREPSLQTFRCLTIPYGNGARAAYMP